MIFALTMLPFLNAGTPPLQPGDTTRSLQVDRRTRTYLVHVPKSYDGTKPYPVVLAFHGGGSNAEQMVRFCGLSEKADQAGFLVVYPNGTGLLPAMLTWNGGNCCGFAMQHQVNDVAFIRALLDDLESALKVDRRRIYAWPPSSQIELPRSRRWPDRWAPRRARPSVRYRSFISTVPTMNLPPSREGMGQKACRVRISTLWTIRSVPGSKRTAAPNNRSWSGMPTKPRTGRPSSGKPTGREWMGPRLSSW